MLVWTPLPSQVGEHAVPRWCDLLGGLLDQATDDAITDVTWATESRGVPRTLASTTWVDLALAEGRPDVMIFAFGTNDLHHDRTPAEIVDVYEEMMQRA